MAPVFTLNQILDQIDADSPWQTSVGSIAGTVTFGVVTSDSWIPNSMTEKPGWSQ